MTRDDLVGLVIEAFRDPRANARRVLALPLDRRNVVEALVAVSALSVISLVLVMALSLGSFGSDLLPNPFNLMVLQLMAMMGLSLALAFMGRAVGGQGDLWGSIRIISWIQFVMVLVQIAQLVLLAVLPPLGALAGIASLVLMIWVSVGQVAGLHGFTSLPKTLAGMVLGLVVVGFVLSLLLAPFLPSPI